MLNRRKFLEKAVAAGMLSMLSGVVKSNSLISAIPEKKSLPVFISTWNHGIPANYIANKVLESEGSIVDAVEKAVMAIEADPKNTSVGIGGYPDRDGFVTLDASIMGPDHNAGSVCFLQNIKHPISVARLVMEKTPHVMLAGDGALQSASPGLRSGASEKC